MPIVYAIVLGGLFGFTLQRAGISSATNIMNMVTLRDTKIIKIILLALAVSIPGVFALQAFSAEAVHFSVKTLHWGVVVGGLLFGLGFAVGGYCPGTSLCAVSEGRRDALFFVLGGLGGALAFSLLYGALADTWLLGELAGGKTTLLDTGSSKYHALIEAVPSLAAALVLGAGLAFAAWRIPTRSPAAKTEGGSP